MVEVVVATPMYGGLPQWQVCRALCVYHLTCAFQQVLALWLCLQTGDYKNEATYPRSPKKDSDAGIWLTAGPTGLLWGLSGVCGSSPYMYV